MEEWGVLSDEVKKKGEKIKVLGKEAVEVLKKANLLNIILNKQRKSD